MITQFLDFSTSATIATVINCLYPRENLSVTSSSRKTTPFPLHLQQSLMKMMIQKWCFNLLCIFKKSSDMENINEELHSLLPMNKDTKEGWLQRLLEKSQAKKGWLLFPILSKVIIPSKLDYQQSPTVKRNASSSKREKNIHKFIRINKTFQHKT